MSLLGRGGLLWYVLLLVIEEIEEGKPNHANIFQTSACATSITIPLFKGSHGAKTKSRAAEVHPYPQMATAKGDQCVILLQGDENSEVDNLFISKS